jgi:uncharacterized protein (TIGR02996 family)
MTGLGPAAATEMGRAFQRSICENPGDDGVRLVYSDWLEENGWPEQAEYIRLDVELAAAPGQGHPRRRRENRRDKLLAAHEAAWLWPLPDLVADGKPRPRWIFARGFAAELSIPLHVFIENAAAIFRLQPITTVKISVGPTWLGRDVRTLFDRDLTGRGDLASRIPGVFFPFLTRVGFEVSIHGATATFPRSVRGELLVARAAVAFGRDRAGLPPLAWENGQPAPQPGR